MSYVNHSYQLQEEEIRLVTVLPAPHHIHLPPGSHVEDWVHCSISHYPLEHVPQYTALSYTWGSAALRAPIVIDGHMTDVTKNLEEALRSLRPKYGEEPLPLWVDDLCIDQHNDAEKSEQVSHMREIYQKATSVTAWLGSAADDSDLAIEWIKAFGHRAWELGIGSKPELQLIRLLKTGDNKQTKPVLAQFLKDLTAELSPENPKDHRLGPALTSLFQRPYWGRIWVVQEVAVAESIIFTCGRSQVSEEHLHQALRLFRNFLFHQSLGRHVKRDIHPEAKPSPEMSRIDPSRPINLLKIRRASGPLPLIYLVRSLRQFRASDPRDKIFALLGISSDRESLGIVADYSKPCAKVYTDAAYALMRNGWMEVLSLNGSIKSVENLPSWVPDWSHSTHPGYLQQRALLRSTKPLQSVLQPRFSVSGEKEHRAHILQHLVTSKGERLVLEAYKVDTVQHAGEPWRDRDIGGWLQELQSLALRAKLVDFSTVWRCAVADQEIRQANDKPRMGSKLLKHIEEVLSTYDKAHVDAESLTKLGLGDYAVQIQSAAHHRRPFLTAGSLLGVGPREIRAGDDVIVVPGADVPYAVRWRGIGDHYQLVGEIYLHGMMDGEAMDQDLQLSTLELD